MSTNSIKACNVSRGASENDIKEFFSYSGEIEHVEMHSENEQSQIAYVSFKDAQGAETAALLSGATIGDQPITIALAPDFKPSITASSPAVQKEEANANDSSSEGSGSGSVVHKAEDVVSTMLAKGFILGKDAANKAKALDEKHQLVSAASAKMASIDQKMGLSEKMSAGSTLVNDKMKEVDDKYHVKEKTKSALAAAEQRVSHASSAIMKNRYVLTGATWATGAYNRVAKTAEEVGHKTREKLADQQRDIIASGEPQSHAPTPTTTHPSANPMSN